MMKKRDTRQILIEEGQNAFLLNGYDGVGLATILKDAGIPKGSFYFFFESKESFALAILDAYESHYMALRSSFFGDVSRAPLERLSAYFDCLRDIHVKEEFLRGCLFGVLAQTAAARSPAIRDRLTEVFARWTAQLSQVLREAQASGALGLNVDPDAVASFLIDAYEGALVRARAEGNMRALDRFALFARGVVAL